MASEIRTFVRNYFLQSTTLPVAIKLTACFLCVFSQSVTAQVCADPSGPLVVNQTFGKSGKALSADLTSYPYEAINCPGDGQYTIAATLDGSCYNATWHVIGSDHTPNEAGGSMMLVNGGNKAGPFYQQPVAGLCSGTTYEVSFWIINLLRTGTCLNPLIPDLAIDIVTTTGVVIQSTALGLIGQTDEPTWRQYKAVFTVPAGLDDVVIKLVDYQGDFGCGNDMAIDDFQVKQCSECVGVPEALYVPDIFTPNNDGINDALAVFLRVTGVTSFSLNIYDRWGNPIYATTDQTRHWDGTYAGVLCQSDTYTWVVAYSTIGKTRYVRTGHVLLMR